MRGVAAVVRPAFVVFKSRPALAEADLIHQTALQVIEVKPLGLEVKLAPVEGDDMPVIGAVVVDDADGDMSELSQISGPGPNVQT